MRKKEEGSQYARSGQTYLGTEAVSHSTDLLEALLLQPLETGHHDGVHGLLGVGVLSVGALSQPLEEVQAVGLGHGEWVAVEDVHDDGVVAVCGELVGHQLGVLPDAEDVGNVEERDAVVLVGARGLGDVGVILADLDDAAGGLATAEGEEGMSSVLERVSLPRSGMAPGCKPEKERSG